MFKLPQQSKQLKQGQVFNGPWKLWLRGGFCDARPTVVQKVLEGLTKFNSLNKALLGSTAGWQGWALFWKNRCLFCMDLDLVFAKLNPPFRCTQICFFFDLRWKNRFGAMLMWGEMPTTKTHLPSITRGTIFPGRVLPLRGALRRGFARDLRIWIQSTGHLWEGPLCCTGLFGGWFGVCSGMWVVFVNQFRFDWWCTWPPWPPP